jgi:hypothetical protein
MAIADQMEMANSQPNKPMTEPYYGAGMQNAPEVTTNDMAQLAPEQYPKKEIVTNTGEKQTVYTSGPLAGQIVGQQGVYAVQADSNVSTKTGKTPVDETPVQDNTGRQSAYDDLYNEFSKYGLGSLVENIKDLITSNLSPSGFSIALQNTDEYKKRFSANQDRIKAGLRPLSPAAYIGLEDQYQNIMRNYGLPASYYSKDSTGKQSGFDKFIAGDVSADELENRIMTAQSRVINANPEVTAALKQFYPDITNSDILAYTLDPTKGLEDIKRKVTTAEIGGAALQAGLTTNLARAEELNKYGVDKAEATAGYSTIGGGLQRGSELASIYGESPYTQATAESEIFKLSGAQEARKQRQKVTGLEKATFGGQTGVSGGALARDRAGCY